MKTSYCMSLQTYSDCGQSMFMEVHRLYNKQQGHINYHQSTPTYPILVRRNRFVIRDTHIMLFKVPIMLCSNSQHQVNYAPVKIMPHYPLYGHRWGKTGDCWGNWLLDLALGVGLLIFINLWATWYKPKYTERKQFSCLYTNVLTWKYCPRRGAFIFRKSQIPYQPHPCLYRG